MMKLENGAKRMDRTRERLAQLINTILPGVSKNCGGEGDVPHPIGQEAHLTHVRCVYSNGIGSHDHRTQLAIGTLQGAVALHGNNAVSDDESDWHGGSDVKDTFVDAGPVKRVFRPAVARA